MPRGLRFGAAPPKNPPTPNADSPATACLTPLPTEAGHLSLTPQVPILYRVPEPLGRYIAGTWGVRVYDTSTTN